VAALPMWALKKVVHGFFFFLKKIFFFVVNQSRLLGVLVTNGFGVCWPACSMVTGIVCSGWC
jgi:hypothetical protein